MGTGAQSDMIEGSLEYGGGRQGLWEALRTASKEVGWIEGGSNGSKEVLEYLKFLKLFSSAPSTRTFSIVRTGRGARDVGKKRTHSDTLTFPVRRTREQPAGGERKLSEIIKEMALRLLKKPDALPSMAAAETALLLASAAWNFASGEPDLRTQQREMFKKFDRRGALPWAELLSSDTDRLIAELVDYKQAHYASDRRIIVAVGMSPAGNVQVHWAEDDNLITAPFDSRPSHAAAATAERGNSIAEKLIAKMRRKSHGKVVNIRDIIAGRAAAEELQKTVATKEALAGFHPAHAAYVYTQNQVSVMSELLTALDEMAPFAEIVLRAEDLYMPSAPPMSPLTRSFTPTDTLSTEEATHG